MNVSRLIFTLLSLSTLSIVRAQSSTVYSDSNSNADSLKYERELMEVVVKTNRKYVKPTGRGIKVSMASNPVSKLGSAVDALKQLPMIDASKGTIDVLGHGTPQIYIDNKLVRNILELTMLPSENIKEVEIITNPSSKYGTDVSSVILIRTKKINDGFHAVAAGNATITDAISANGEITMNYHTENGFTFFSNFSYGTSAYHQNRYYGEMFFIPNNCDELFHTQTYANVKSRSQSLSTEEGFNYDFGKHSIGVKYAFYRTPDSHFSDTANTKTDTRVDFPQISSRTNLNSQNSMHHVNMFGDFKLPLDVNLRIDADYIHFSKKSASSVYENESSEWANNRNQTLSNLWAIKLLLTQKLQNIEFEIGSDLSLTSNVQDFTSETSDKSSFLKPGEDNIKQNLYAIFGSFDWSPCKIWNLYGGLRWESTDSKYRHDNTLNQDLSRSYENILPNIGISFNSSIRATLFYRASVYRPGYQSLDNNYIYVTPTLWETGNPELKTTLVHRIGLNLSYKKFTLQGSLKMNKRNVSTIYYHDTDKGINVTKPINLPLYNSFQFIAVQQLDFGIWHPTLQGVLYLQDLNYGTPYRKYNKPLYTISLNNRFDLPGGINAYLNIYVLGTGNQDVLYSHGAWQTSLTFNKSWKKWTVTLSANDLFGTWRQPFDTHTNSLEYTSIRKGGSQYISLSISYSLNSAKSKYKGKIVRQDELDRINNGK